MSLCDLLPYCVHGVLIGLFSRSLDSVMVVSGQFLTKVPYVLKTGRHTTLSNRKVSKSFLFFVFFGLFIFTSIILSLRESTCIFTVVRFRISLKIITDEVRTLYIILWSIRCTEYFSVILYIFVWLSEWRIYYSLYHWFNFLFLLFFM